MGMTQKVKVAPVISYRLSGRFVPFSMYISYYLPKKMLCFGTSCRVRIARDSGDVIGCLDHFVCQHHIADSVGMHN